ncbi:MULTISPECIES: hypothetical protein [Streptomyces]|nr:hypothetical protein [Streptomyces xanthii]
MRSLAYLPDSGAVPPWLRVLFGVVVLGLLAARLWLFWRRRK